ncbi:MAG: zinc ribbon domain-containing protein [Planctomycetota bacterium]
MTHSISSRGERRWSYYVCSKAEKQGAKACPKSRVARVEIEDFVVSKIREIGRDPALVRESIEAAKRAHTARTPALIADARGFEQTPGV